MSSRLRPGRLVVCFLSLALPAAAQLDSFALRTKFGAPLNRETFAMPAGFDLIVDYGPGNQVCKLTVPALMPTNGQVARASEMKQRTYNFLADLVPASMRGKELGRQSSSMGIVSLQSIEYENVRISELLHGTEPFNNNDTITITFKNPDCQRPQ
jgi:hypothetical protein